MICNRYYSFSHSLSKLEKKMKTLSTILAIGALAVSTASQAQTVVHAGVSITDGATIGLSFLVSDNYNARIEIGTGLNHHEDGNSSGVAYTANYNSNTAGAFADWFPISGSKFRVVSGFNYNESKINLTSTEGNATINNISVNMNGEYLNVDISMPNITPYIGIGYGHRNLNVKGFEIYGDVGMKIGRVNIDYRSSLVSSGKVTQADLDAQIEKIRSDIGGSDVLPTLSVGASYIF
jgi:hypothetical protein